MDEREKAIKVLAAQLMAIPMIRMDSNAANKMAQYMIDERVLGDLEGIDEVKEKEQPKDDGQKETKKRAVFKHFDGHDCETWYTCPYCGKTFGSWEVFRQKQNENGTSEYCPRCKKEVAGLG